MATLEELTAAVVDGKRDDAVRLTDELLASGTPPFRIVDEGLVPGMGIVGDRFKNCEIYVPEMLIAARAMKEAMAVVEPLLAESGYTPQHTVIIGTVQGDLHDIGKNLVALMWKGAAFDVIDLGTNVSADAFVAAAKEHAADLVGLSALLTTTMPAMKETVAALRAADIGDCKILIGGAPISAEFAAEIGADGHAGDAATAVDKAKELLGVS